MWAMTERGAKFLDRSATRLRIGPSGLHWDGSQLIAQIDEITVPVPRRLQGVIRLKPRAIQAQTFTLDEAGRHRWRPIAPVARVEVEFHRPEMTWRGDAYFDSNDGDAPLAEDFSTWHWSRAATPTGATILYDVERRNAGPLSLALQIGHNGNAKNFTPPAEQQLPAGMWGVARRTRADDGFAPRVLQTFEDAPFYMRSKVATRIGGVDMEAMHESLSLDRFRQPWVRALLPFRMPRRI
jgi:carotenoid 1,2-hydratase